MHSVSISQKAPKWVIAGSIENNGHNWLRMIILLLLESMTGIHAGSTLAGPLYEMMGWDAADRGLTGGQMVIWTPAVRSATRPVSLTKLSAVDVNRSKLRSTMPVIPVLSPALLIQSAGEYGVRIPALWRSRWAGCTGPALDGHLQQNNTRMRTWRQRIPAEPALCRAAKWTVVTARDLIAWLKSIELFVRSLDKTTQDLVTFLPIHALL